MSDTPQELIIPFRNAPEPGDVIEVAPGVLWARFPMPFQLNHVNVYLIDDGNGWAVLDTGLGDETTRSVWEQLLAGPLRGRRLTRVIVSHFHPDHIGLAGWLAKRFDIPLITSQTTYLGCLNVSLAPGALEAKPYHEFYLRHGLDAHTAGLVLTRGHEYLKLVSELPLTFIRLAAGDTLDIGGRTFAIYTGDGHAPEQVMLYCAEEKLFLAADQVIAKISPNVSVWAVEPEGDPLGLYLRSLGALKSTLPPEAIVFPGHQFPFIGLHLRVDELIKLHGERCEAIFKACHHQTRSVADLVPVVFHRPLDPHQMGFAFSEVLAHVNFMVRNRKLAWAEVKNGIQQIVVAQDQGRPTASSSA